MPPSSSGGIAVLQILGELERFDVARMKPGTAETVHLVTEAERLAFADRDKWVADDRFVDVPVQGLVDPAYVRSRSMLIDAGHAMGKAAEQAMEGSEGADLRAAEDEARGHSKAEGQ